MATVDPVGAAGGAWRREHSTLVLAEVDSPQQVAAPFAIAVERDYAPTPVEFEPHTHLLDELVWVRGGTMTVHVSDRLFTLPEGHGLWLPAGVDHSGRMTGHTELFSVMFDPQRSPVRFDHAVNIDISAVLAALLTHLERADLPIDARLRAEAVVFDLLRPAEEEFSLQVPRGRWIDPIVGSLLADPADNRTLREWARQVGTGERTVARAFRSATGLTFQQWRQVLRVHRALTLLAEGREVREVSEQLGYAQPSTFIASFKRVTGHTPGAYPAAAPSF